MERDEQERESRTMARVARARSTGTMVSSGVAERKAGNAGALRGRDWRAVDGGEQRDRDEREGLGEEHGYVEQVFTAD